VKKCVEPLPRMVSTVLYVCALCQYQVLTRIFCFIVACKEFPDLDDPSFILGQEEEVEATRRRRSQA